MKDYSGQCSNCRKEKHGKCFGTCVCECCTDLTEEQCLKLIICGLCKRQIVPSEQFDYHGHITHLDCANDRDDERKRILDKLGDRRVEN